jgi:hypothetical protein
MAKLAHEALDAINVVVVEKTRDWKKNHPYLPYAAVRAIEDRLRSELTASQLATHLVTVKAGSPTFTTRDFQAVVAKEGWRRGNNEYHNCDEEIRRRRYSQKAVDVAVNRICKDSSYLRKARESYAAVIKAKRRDPNS